jgi:hypothetical protein
MKPSQKDDESWRRHHHHCRHQVHHHLRLLLFPPPPRRRHLHITNRLFTTATTQSKVVARRILAIRMRI